MAPPTNKLHEAAMRAEAAAEEVATFLGQAGADDDTVKAVTQMAGAFRQIAAKTATQMQEEPPPPRPTTDQAISEHMAARRAAPPAPPE
jgi:predicted HAD superfamily Cof-like phosphohydrolase